MESVSLSLEEGLRLHPNVAYVPKKPKQSPITAVIPSEFFRSVNVGKVRKLLLNSPAEVSRGLYTRLPNIWARTGGLDGMCEKAVLEHRLEMFKSKKPEAFNTHYQRASEKIKELYDKEAELQNVLADFKESVCIYYENERRNKQ